jgi:hypothetical protein
VTTLRLDEIGALEVKIRLEREDPVGKFLLYAPTDEPDYEEDWLLDIRLYSRSFRADRAYKGSTCGVEFESNWSHCNSAVSDLSLFRRNRGVVPDAYPRNR